MWQAVARELPRPLRHELLESVMAEHVLRAPFMADLASGVLHDLMSAMEQMFLVPEPRIYF